MKAGKEQYIRFVSEFKCGICGDKLLYDKFMDRYESDRFLCDICLRSKQIAGGVYHCKHCRFDVCNNCPDLLNTLKLRICQKCGNQLYHLHALTDPVTGKYVCFLCEREGVDQDGVFACENCEFRMCPECEKDIRKRQLFSLLKKNHEEVLPTNVLSGPGSPLRNKAEKAKKAGLQLGNLHEEEKNNNEPFPEFQGKEEDLITFSGKKRELQTVRFPEEPAGRLKPEEGSQPLQADRVEFEIHQIVPAVRNNDSFSLRNESIHMKPIGDFPLKTELDLLSYISQTGRTLPESSVQPLDYREPLPWAPESENYRKI